MSNQILEATAEFVKALEGELAHARASWAVFKVGNGLEEEDTREIFELLEGTYAHHTFDFLIRTTATMTVLTLARMTDPPKSDRYTLIGLKQLIQKDVEVFAVAAEGWLPGAPEHAKENREYVEREVPVLVSEISKFCKSAEIQRIRSLRDEALAHRLRGKTLRPTYSDVGNAFEHAHRIVSKASSILTGRIWTPSDFFDVQELYAKDFWDAFQKGLVVQKEGRGAAS